ncbi:hypothetical protein AQJ66_24915 [Streptomyces bungoensis]|uniref:Uncharacterized protein n=1 Tax=Streptomyces bungoensis TaxID=285568 RepID=A0A101SVM6_9ACTN|nr:hypothetical protein [Streptomyces bungoensis]KUN80927.1 hypothetical protein AQJ66_24915 [Streptomyces bungoensis]
MLVLVLCVALLLVVVDLAVVVGLGYVVHRRPALAVPVGVSLTAAGVLITATVGILQAAVS